MNYSEPADVQHCSPMLHKVQTLCNSDCRWSPKLVYTYQAKINEMLAAAQFQQHFWTIFWEAKLCKWFSSVFVTWELWVGINCFHYASWPWMRRNACLLLPVVCVKLMKQQCDATITCSLLTSLCWLQHAYRQKSCCYELLNRRLHQLQKLPGHEQTLHVCFRWYRSTGRTDILTDGRKVVSRTAGDAFVAEALLPRSLQQ